MSNSVILLVFQAMDRWEETTDLILEREILLEKLEKFERKASDPNRFFEKNERGSISFFIWVCLLC